MTTEEQKARELYEKFLTVDGFCDLVLPHSLAKQCALIAVEEIMNANHVFTQPLFHPFWKEVKKQIEVL